MSNILHKLIDALKGDVVLCIAILLAAVSSSFVSPDRNYLGYIDFKTLCILFCLMAVMAGFKNDGVFLKIAETLLSKVKSMRTVVIILVLLCFFGSMLVTNDVALVTFVPLTITVLNLMRKEQKNNWIVAIVVLQTIAANLGSMLTPVGSPQNLYLYSQSGMSPVEFLLTTLPYAAVSLAGIIAVILIRSRIPGCNAKIGVTFDADEISIRKTTYVYFLLFLISLMTVAKVIPYIFATVIVGGAIFILDRKVLKDVDYALLLTFIGFFIFIGNLQRIEVVSEFINTVVSGREVITSVVSSQFVSNVPTAILLSGFTENYESLIIGTNIGGLGTLIASMASLISYKILVKDMPRIKGRYLKKFTLANICFIILLLTFHFIFRLMSGLV